MVDTIVLERLHKQLPFSSVKNICNINKNYHWTHTKTVVAEFMPCLNSDHNSKD